MKSGYAYCYSGTPDSWRASKDDDWEVIMQSRAGRAQFLGMRSIDGTRCTVWLVARKGVGPKVYAQSAAHTPPPRGLR